MPKIDKPKYLDPLGDPRLNHLSVSPPFLFRNVTARVFPLAANMAVLTRFCDAYLNMDISPRIVHYAPALPYVFLQVLNYGSMAAASVQAQNAGWVGQHEVTFTVLLQRWREVDGELVFKDWATVSPFIYVDDGMSLNTGREVYGWNKVAGFIDSAVPLWLNDPRAKLRQFGMSVIDFRTAYAGDTETLQPLLRVDLDPPPTFLEFPPDPRNAWSPIWAAPNMIANGVSLGASALDIAMSLRVRGYEAHRSKESIAAMVREAGTKLKSVVLQPGGRLAGLTMEKRVIEDLPMLFFDNVTLKQFRNPEDPNLACYQALVNSRMGVDRLNRAGLLGDVNLLRGDTSGGYTVQIHNLDAQPIVSTLGLEISSHLNPTATDGTVTLKPVLPYWLDVDLFYGEGHVICSRTPWGPSGPHGGWVDEQERKKDPPVAAAKANPKVLPLADLNAPPLYNATLGAATQAISGPFHFPDVTLQVYPMLSDAAKIREMVDRHLNEPLAKMYKPDLSPVQTEVEDGWRFEPFGSYVYMMVTVYGDELGEEWSSSNNIGGFFSREVTFCVPVKWYDNQGKLVSVGMIEPFTYSNSGRGVATDREVNGYNSILATIESPQDVWLNDAGPIGKRRYLSLATEVIPAANMGQEAEQRTLIEIDERDIIDLNDAQRWRGVADTWGREFIDDLRRKTSQAAEGAEGEQVIQAKALALELLAHGQPFNRLIYKQYRDSLDPQLACYQALVHATSTITSIYDIRELPTNCHIRFHREPGNMIVDALGLKTKLVDSEAGSVVDIVEPVRPFWMRIAMREDLATVACYRAEDKPWRVVHPWFTSPPDDDPSDRQGPPPETGIGDKPFFRRIGNAHSGAWLARVPPVVLPLRPSGDAAITFPDKGDVEAWLGHRMEGEQIGANLHLDLRTHALDWERRALVNELAWIRNCLEPDMGYEPHDPLWKETLAKSGDADIRALVDCPVAAPLELGLIGNITMQYSAQDLWRLKGKIDTALKKMLPFPVPDDALPAAKRTKPDAIGEYSKRFYEDLSHVASTFDAFFKASTAGIEQNGLAWSWNGFLDGRITNFSLNDSVAKFESLSRLKRRAFIMSLPSGAQSLLTEVVAYIDSPKFTSDTSFDSYQEVNLSKVQDVRAGIQLVGQLADIIEIRLLDWVYPSRWRRISIAEAAETVRTLDEVQMVVDNILSSEWENHGRTRWANPLGGRLPDEFIPDGPAVGLIAGTEGLRRWVDPATGQPGDRWISPLPVVASDPTRRSRYGAASSEAS